MSKLETFITIALYALLFALGSASVVGFLIGAVWTGIGLWMVSRTQSRGILADLSLIVTWPVYVVLGR